MGEETMENHLTEEPPSLDQLMDRVAAKAPDKWKNIAIQLGISQAWINALADDSGAMNSTSDIYAKIFNNWQCQRKRPYTWGFLIDVLRGVNHSQLADELKKKYCSDKEPLLHELQNEVAAIIPSKWKAVGLQLGLTLDEIAGIAPGSDPATVVHNCFVSIFSEWKNRNQVPYTWSKMIEVLRNPDVRCDDIADELAKYLNLPMQALTQRPHIRRKINWKKILIMCTPAILCLLLLGVVCPTSILCNCLTITDYSQIINSGDTVLLSIHSQSLLTSLVISVTSTCQGTLYIVPGIEVTLRKQNRARSETLNAQYLYLGVGSVIHFIKAAATNDTPQVLVTDSLETATSIANNANMYIHVCAAPPQGTVCHMFMVNADSWDCKINETSYYWIQVLEKSKYDIGWNFTLYYYNQTDYTSYIHYQLDSTLLSSVLIQLNQSFAKSQSLALLFTADANSCQYDNIKFSDAKIRDDLICGGPFLLSILLFFLSLLCFCYMKLCRWIAVRLRSDDHMPLLNTRAS